MFRRILGKKELLIGGLFTVFQSEPIDFEKYKEARGLHIEDDWERVKVIFSKDDFGNLHPELVRAMQMGQIGLFVGATFGGWINSVRRTQEFIKNNDANLFFNVKDAHRKLAQESILSFGKGAVRWAPRYGFFLGGYSIISSCFEAYRNKSGIIENTVGGGGIGAICRMNYGLKGMISGGIIGAILGTIYGIVTFVISKLSKTDIIDIKYAQYALVRYRQEAIASKQSTGEEENLNIPSGSQHISHIPNPLESLEEDKSS